MIQFDFDEVIEFNLPIHLRQFKILAYLKFISTPFKRLLNEFYEFTNKVKYEVSFNGQVIYLEHILNDTFDNVNRGIYITDADQEDQVFLFNQAEQNEKTYLYNISESGPETYLYNQSESLSWPNFIVNVPSGVTYDENQMKALINKYKLAGKKYKIVVV